MMRALYSGTAGLTNHLTRQDVIGNNISNVNTVGFKASRVNFQDILSQTIQGAAAPQGNRGGTNPKQIGLGVSVASIDTLFTDGAPQTTGKQTDLYIEGQGFFVVSDGTSQYYTRAGNFDFDAQGNYIIPGTGLKVMGWMADGDGVINSSSNIQGIQIPVGATMAANETTSFDFINNLPADDEVGKIRQTNTVVYDSLGNAHDMNTKFIKVADNKWIYNVQVPDAAAAPAITNTCGEITFGADGQNPVVKQATSAGATTAVGLNGLDLDNELKSKHAINSIVWDDKQVPHVVTTTFTNTGTNSWSYSITESGTTKSLAAGTVTWDTTLATPAYVFSPATNTFTVAGGTPTTFSMAGVATAPAAGQFNVTQATTPNPGYATSQPVNDVTFTPTGGANPMKIKMNFSALHQFAGDNSIQAANGDGYQAGTLDMAKLTIDQNGIITGTFTNGRSKSLGQVALAVFNNPAGLNKAGQTMFTKSNNSGDAQIGTGASGGRGKFISSTLEMSNVDLAQQFSDMITTQRGFQANSKIITTSDEMLEILANLKR